MFTQILTYIRSRSRSDWRNITQRLILLVREWLNQHGEVSAIIGVVVGIAIVLFFKLLLVCAVLFSLIGFAVYSLATED